MSTLGGASMGAYTASKHGVAGLTKTLALELGEHGITANFVQPGAIVTGITRPVLDTDPAFREFWTRKSALGRLGQPEDVAAAIAFLVSEDAGFVTGHGLAVDGGDAQRLIGPGPATHRPAQPLSSRQKSQVGRFSARRGAGASGIRTGEQMTVHRTVKRYADPATSKTPPEKAPDPELGHDFIPGERYTSREFMELEWERLWTKVWLLGCWEGDLAAPGDYVVTDIGDESIVLTRDEDGGVNAFYNVCSHRGNQIAYGGGGNRRTFRCSYHLWEYDLKGRLVSVPDLETFPQGAPCEKLSIKRLPCDTWGGWVWFSLNPNAEPLPDYLGMIPEHLDPYHFERMALVNDITVEWPCNWKASVDAFNESYHVAGTHPQLMTMLEDYDTQIDVYDKHSRYLIPFGTVSSHLKDDETVSDALRAYLEHMGFTGFNGPARDARRELQLFLREHAHELGWDFSELNDDQLSDDYHYMIFPNITLNIHCNSMLFFRQRPHESDPNRMYYDLQNYVLPKAGETPPPRPEHRFYRHGEVSLGEVLDQDASNLPMVQKGMRSAGFRGLWIGDQELRIRHFHKTIDDYLFRGKIRIVE